MALSRESAYSRLLLPLMPRKPMLIAGGEPLSPKRTADMIRQLRELTRDLRMLKTRLETEEKGKRQRTVLASRRRRRAD